MCVCERDHIYQCLHWLKLGFQLPGDVGLGFHGDVHSQVGVVWMTQHCLYSLSDEPPFDIVED